MPLPVKTTVIEPGCLIRRPGLLHWGSHSNQLMKRILINPLNLLIISISFQLIGNIVQKQTPGAFWLNPVRPMWTVWRLSLPLLHQKFFFLLAHRFFYVRDTQTIPRCSEDRQALTPMAGQNASWGANPELLPAKSEVMWPPNHPNHPRHHHSPVNVAMVTTNQSHQSLTCQ